MPAPRTLAEFLVEYAHADVEGARTDQGIDALVLRFATGRRGVLLDKRWRAAMRSIADPTDAELAAARSGDLRALWDGASGDLLTGIVRDPETGEFEPVDPEEMWRYLDRFAGEE